MKQNCLKLPCLIVCLIACIALSACFLTGCGKNSYKDDGKLVIVTTIFPEYDWVLNILGDNPANGEVIMLLDNGVDLHNYQPSADDILKISTCDVFIYIGGPSDSWIDDALKGAQNKDMKVIDLMDVLGDAVREEEEVEGMQSEDHDDNEESSHEQEEVEYDEHIWLSLGNAEILTEKIAEEIAAADPDNAQLYMDNAKAYVSKLAALDEEYKAAVKAGSKDTILFGDRFPFRYLTDDYNLNYYAAFAGCSAETEASFETITFLAAKVDELNLDCVLITESSDGSIARTVISSTKTGKVKTLTLNSMQSVTTEDAENGTSYLSIMRDNLKVLEEALK